jgi:hypothetical protein
VYRIHELVRPADEPVDHLSFTQDPTQLGEDSHVDPDGKTLAIHQHTVAVEDDELDRPSHDRARYANVQGAPGGVNAGDRTRGVNA